MPCPPPFHPPAPPSAGGLCWRRWWCTACVWFGLLAPLLGPALPALLVPAAAQAQGVDLTTLKVSRADTGLVLDYSARLSLSQPIEEALQRGVPLYFTAQALVLRSRWYWRDERVARPSRTWRVAFQPLTSSWRVSLGGLSQVYPTLADALASLARVRGWQLAEPERLEAGERYTVEFSFRLDTAQLPPPMQINVGNDYKLGIERTLRVD